MSLAIFAVLTYSFLIHIGMLIWFISGIRSLFKKNLRIERNLVKIVFASFALFMSVVVISNYFMNFYGEQGVGYLLTANIPAFFLSGGGSDVGIIFFYLLFGFIGGWGIGQFVEWLTNKIRH